MGILEAWAMGAIDDFKEEVVSSLQGRLEEICREVTKELREKITDIWFRQWNGTHTKEATQYNPSSSINGDTIHCVVVTFVDSGAYAGAAEAKRYMSQHRNYPEEKPPVDWVLSKFHDEGIIGLPLEGKIFHPPGSPYHPHWHNDEFHQFNTLTEEMETNPLWKYFEPKVASRL